MIGSRGRPYRSRALRRLSAGMTMAVAASCVVAARPQPAAATDFVLKNCIDEGLPYAVSAFYEGGSRVEAKSCNDGGSGGQLQLNGRGGHTAQGEYGAWVWQPGGEEGIVDATVTAKLRNSGGFSAQLYAIRPDGTPLVFGSDGDGQFRTYNLYAGSTGPTGVPRVVAQLKCYRADGCDLQTLGGATTRPDDIRLTVRDRGAPTVGVSGALVDESRWHRGSESASVTASDSGAGVAGFTMRVDGQREVNLGSVPCSGDRGAFAVSFHPCPASWSLPTSFDAGSLGAGAHTLQFCARDYGSGGGNESCTPGYTLKVDEDPPQQPEHLEVAGGETAWRADNAFDVSWGLPAQGEGSPIAAVHYRLLYPDGEALVGDTRIPEPIDRLDDLQVPQAPGVYTLEVWLEDATGNVGAPARVELRYDPARPGRSLPLVQQGWISRNEFPYSIRLSHPAEPLPVSGIQGYAVEIDQDPGSSPCVAADRCAPLEVDLSGGIEDDSFAVSDLPEGTSYVHAAAVSGSGMRSLDTGLATLHVDKSDPVTSLEGAPGSWSSNPVKVTATATDALSGMAPSPGEPDPFTAIKVDDGPTITATGPSVSATIRDDGVHRVAYYARDLAGNVNDGASGDGWSNRPPSTAIVRIDLDAPAVAFLDAQDPDDPELIRARVSDPLSGPDGSRGRISFRRAGSAEPFAPLPTEHRGGLLEARWPSESYPAGEYEFRATGYDAAGNAFTTTQRANGTRMVLPNPLKVPTALRAGFGGKARFARVCRRVRRRGHSRRRCRRRRVRGFNRRPLRLVAPYRGAALFSGRLSAGLGSPLPDASVRVIETFAPGSRLQPRVTTARTGGDGIFLLRLAPGPSRTVEAVFDGSRTLTGSAARLATLRVRGSVRLRVSSHVATVGGRPIVFSGRVGSAGAAIPPEGKSVELQFRLPGLPWTEFRTVHTDPAGRFHLAYRFADDESRGVRFQFRAYAPRQDGWPYEPAGSRPVVVRGR